MEIVAKPVINNQYWILRRENQKVGNIEATGDGFSVRINNSVQKFKTINMVKARTGISFEKSPQRPTEDPNQVYGYPAGGKAYNHIFEGRKHLPLFTKTPNSKSWYAAGWYRIWTNRRWSTEQSPKLITLNRYQYKGPFKTREEAES